MHSRLKTHIETKGVNCILAFKINLTIVSCLLSILGNFEIKLTEWCTQPISGNSSFSSYIERRKVDDGKGFSEVLVFCWVKKVFIWHSSGHKGRRYQGWPLICFFFINGPLFFSILVLCSVLEFSLSLFSTMWTLVF